MPYIPPIVCPHCGKQRHWIAVNQKLDGYYSFCCQKECGKRRSLISEIRLWIVSILVLWIGKILPKDATEYWQWLSKIPFK